MKLPINERVIAALDVDTLDQARDLVKELSGVISTFKIGSELFSAVGPDVVKMIVDSGCRVFLDLKFFDIPNTVFRSVKALSRLGIYMFNVHSLGGSAMMRAAKEAASEFSKKPLVLGVTLLTSLDMGDLDEVGFSLSVSDSVARLARLAKDSGLDGVVSSPLEAGGIKKDLGEDFLVVTPGVRLAWAEANDQKRVMTPREALSSGADFIVVGRPIYASPDPKGAAKKIIEEISDH
jgi:orotidine-5'-phosphate decarboxylase